MASSDAHDPKAVPPVAADDSSTRYRTPPAEAPDQSATNYRTAPADPDATGSPPPATRRATGRRVLPCRFGDYDLLEEIARGGMGVVYRARQQVGGGERLVALKLVQAGRLDSPAAVARFLQEARAAAAQDPPALVPNYDIGEVDGRHYFTMQLMAGGSLAERVREGPLPARVAVSLVRQVAEAAQHAHERGIIHRDLKPANILLANAGLTPPESAAVSGIPNAPLAPPTIRQRWSTSGWRGRARAACR